MPDTLSRQSRLGQQGNAGDQITIFLHIGKTAGTTLSAVLRQRYRGDRLFSLDSHGLASPFDQLARLDRSQVGRLRFVRGHLLYGIHLALPQPAHYITLLRDPCQRLVSTYHHILQRPGHRLHRTLIARQMTFTDFVTSGLTLESDNWQLRCISGDVETRFGQCGSEMLQRAKANIERNFALVGVSEMFDETLVLLGRMYGWRALCYVPLNLRQTGAVSKPLTDSDRLCIAPYVAWDYQLYSHATDLLRALISSLERVDHDVAALRLRNSLYYPIGRALDRLWQPIRAAQTADRVRGRSGHPRGPAL